MQIGVVFPQTEIGADVGAVRAYAEGVEALGFSHVLAYDHVLGADPAVHPGWSRPYDLESTFHEPFVLFGYLAGFTSLEFVTGIVILPQRQTALVAKQAATLDLLSGGRLRGWGGGLGWNEVEQRSTSGKSFLRTGVEDRGTGRVAMRRLWTERSVTLDGTYEHVIGAGLTSPPAAATRSRCGSARSRCPLIDAPVVSPTVGCPRCLPAPSWTRPGPWWTRRRARRVAQPSTIAMEGRGQLGVTKRWGKLVEQAARWRARPVPRTCRSTPWARGWTRWAPTCASSERSPPALEDERLR